MQKNSQNTVMAKEPASFKKEEPRSNRLWFIILLGLIFLGVLGLNSLNPAKQKSAQLLSNSQASPTPFPYRELTVPYLREKTYKSTLGDTQIVSDNGSYTTYLTSYTSEGLKINGLLTIPTGQEPPGWPGSFKRWPAIIFIHGYIPPSQYATLGPQYSDYVDYLARSGFVVFKIDLRGHGDSEGEPGGGYYGSDYVIDALNARAALQNVSSVDPKRIGMWGHSMAGNIVLRSIAAKPDIPAVVIWAGAVYSYTDQRKYGINDASFSPNQFNTQRFSRRREIFEKYGSPSAQSIFWSQVAPTNYLHDLQGAIEIHHAVDDEVVNIGYSRDLIKLLDQTAVSHEFYEYASGGHNITGGSFNQAMERTVAFFKKYLAAE